MTKKSDAGRADIYTRITDRIVEDLERGVRPWMKPWSAANTDGRISRPLRHNGLPYSGMNVLLLWSEQMSRGFASSMWMTFKQVLELGGAVRKGETGSTVVFASRFTRSEADGNGNEVDREIPFLKAYSVFNIEQIDGLPDNYYALPAKILDPIDRIESADRFFRNTGAVIRQGGNQAYYSPVMDYIQMPPFEAFRDAAGYAAVLSHEATHWTAAEHRVGRDLSRYARDRTERAREELIAELGSCFLCADLGIAPEAVSKRASIGGSACPLMKQAKTAIEVGPGVRCHLCPGRMQRQPLPIPSRQSFRQPICELDEACLTGDRLRLDRFPATAASDFLPRKAAPSSFPTNKSATCRPPFHYGPNGCGPIVTGLFDSHRGRDGRGPN